jgi:hypothetical protein
MKTFENCGTTSRGDHVKIICREIIARSEYYAARKNNYRKSAAFFVQKKSGSTAELILLLVKQGVADFLDT